MIATDCDGLVSGVLAAPSDDAPRLVLADYLEEQGDDRHYALRLACACRWTQEYVANGGRAWMTRSGVERPPTLPYLAYMDMRCQCQIIRMQTNDLGESAGKQVALMVEYATLYGITG